MCIYPNRSSLSECHHCHELLPGISPLKPYNSERFDQKNQKTTQDYNTVLEK